MIDTAFLIAGALTAGVYFSAPGADEVEHRVDVALGDFGRDALDFQRLDGLQDDLGKHFEGRDVGQVLAFAHALRFDPGTAGGRQMVLGDRLGETRLHEFADHFAVHLRTELLTNH